MRTLKALRSAIVCCLALAMRAACAADSLPPIERPVHRQTWSSDSLLTTPQIEPLVWESLSYEPRWSGQAGAVFLQRARSESTPFVINPVNGANIIDPADFRFPFVGGVDVGLVRYGTWADIECRYFGIHDWQSGQGPLFSPDGFTLAMAGFDSGANFPVWIRSWNSATLDSFELNLRRNILPRWSLLAGFRYFAYDERLAAFVAGDSGFVNGTIITFRTINDLYGAQIGTEGVLWQPTARFRVEGVLKAGVYANATRSALWAAARGSGGAGDNGKLWLGLDQTAFAGDLNFTGVFQLNEHWALRGGYQLLWLAGVALPAEQLHRLNLANGDVGVNATHGVFFHGALVGLERTW